MKYFQQIVQAFMDGFLPTFGFLAVLWGGWYIYNNSLSELAKLPIIQEITDTYQIGWKETVRIGNRVAARVVTLDEQLQMISDPAGPGTPFGPQNGLSVAVSWDKGELEKKLLEQGWSSGKMNAAYAYLNYIDQYMGAALQDMRSTGVSASITLAQAILESNAGRSRLATTTNNHFGVKALPNRVGRRKIKAKLFHQLRDEDFNFRSPAIGVSQHHDDHKYDRFEVYSSVLDSYYRHSKLLRNGCSRPRKGCYDWIWDAFPVQEERLDLKPMAYRFEKVSGYAPTDFFGETHLPYYAAQAAGLKMAGYATSKTYHRKLVYLIETYELWRFDIALTQVIHKQRAK